MRRTEMGRTQERRSIEAADEKRDAIVRQESKPRVSIGSDEFRSADQPYIQSTRHASFFENDACPCRGPDKKGKRRNGITTLTVDPSKLYKPAGGDDSRVFGLVDRFVVVRHWLGLSRDGEDGARVAGVGDDDGVVFGDERRDRGAARGLVGVVGVGPNVLVRL